MKILFFVIALVTTYSSFTYCQTASDTVIHNYLRQFETPSFSSYKLTYESIPVIDKVDFSKNKLESKKLVYRYYKQSDQGEIFRTEYYINGEPGLVAILTEENAIYYHKKAGFYQEKGKEKSSANLEGLRLSCFHVYDLILQGFKADRIKFIEEELFEGRTCMKFEYQPEYISEAIFFYFDKPSNELYGLIFSKRNYEIYENYKPVNGLVIPTLVTGFLDNEEYYIFNYTNLELDIEISDEMLLEGEQIK